MFRPVTLPPARLHLAGSDIQTTGSKVTKIINIPSKLSNHNYT